MAKRIFTTSINYTTPTALGSAVTDNQYGAIKSTTATQLTDILEITVQGNSTASAVWGGCLARVSTNETGAASALATPNSDGPSHPATAALASAVSTFIHAATTPPTPSNVGTDTKFPMTINAFGGLYRENFAPTQQFSIFGTATPFQESVLFNSTSYNGTSSIVTAAMIYETY